MGVQGGTSQNLSLSMMVMMRMMMRMKRMMMMMMMMMKAAMTMTWIFVRDVRPTNLNHRAAARAMVGVAEC